jgi:hypothetical protein
MEKLIKFEMHVLNLWEKPIILPSVTKENALKRRAKRML